MEQRTCAVDGCNGDLRMRMGYCNAHYLRLRRHGDPLVQLRRSPLALSMEIEAAASDRSEGPCNVLQGFKYRPLFVLDGVKMKASRAVWILACGHPGDLHVLHTCGNGTQGCVRLAHLYLGTHADNMRDMANDGRSNRGERAHNAVLTREIVRQIRARISSGEMLRVIAESFGVTQSTISDIKHGRTWRWLS